MKFFIKKKVVLGILICLMISILCSCRSIALNSVSNMLAGGGGAPSDDGTGMMSVLTGESDVTLMAGFFPTALKLYEIMLTQNPKHEGLAVMTGSLYVMYANAFVQHEAQMLEIDEFDLQMSELERAKLHYLRGRDYVLSGLEVAYPGFTQDILSGDPERIAAATGRLKKEDVNAVYWAGAGWLGAFSLDFLNPVFLASITGAPAMLERAVELDPGFNDGEIWDILCAFYASALPDMGGGFDKALAAHEQAVLYSEGKSISVWNTYAQSICIPQQDGAGYDEALAKALAINPDDNPSNRLASVIAREKTLWLIATRENYFIEW
jgi:predicted anti-sigma-YlaC factor YlaD